YRDPLPLADGSVIVVHDPTKGADTGNGTPASSIYSFRLKTLTTAANGYMTAGQTFTAGLSKSVTYWSPDASISYKGTVGELQPVELHARAVPASTAASLPSIEQSVFDAANVDVGTFQDYLNQNGLALLVGRNVTTRDEADLQQPFNLRV